MSVKDNILGSASVIAKAATDSLKIDKTIVCTVVSHGTDNSYIVSNESIKFIAYSNDNQKYNKNDQVFVLIPEGTYDNKKYITGLYSKEVDNTVYEDGYNDLIILYEEEWEVQNVDKMTFGQTIEQYFTKFDIPSSLSLQGIQKPDEETADLEGVLRPYTQKQVEEFCKIVNNCKTSDRGDLKPYTVLNLETKIKNPKNYETYRMEIFIGDKITEPFYYYSTEMLGNPKYFDGRFFQQKVFSLDTSKEFFYGEVKYSFQYFDEIEINWKDCSADITIDYLKLGIGYSQRDFLKDTCAFQEYKGSYEFDTITQSRKDEQGNFYYKIHNEKTSIPFYYLQAFLIVKDSNTNKFKYVKNILDLPQNYDLTWVMGYTEKLPANSKSDTGDTLLESNIFWKWAEAIPKDINNLLNVALIDWRITLKNDERPYISEIKDGKDKVLYQNIYYIPTNWRMETITQRGHRLSGNSITPPAISLRGYIQDVCDSGYKYWGSSSNEDENEKILFDKIFLTIEDDQYNNGYYLYEYNEREDNYQLYDKDNNLLKERNIKLNIIDEDLVNKILQIVWYTNMPELQHFMKFNWETSKEGKSSLILDNDPEHQRENFEDLFTDPDTNIYVGPNLSAILPKLVNGEGYLTRFITEIKEGEQKDNYQMSYTLNERGKFLEPQFICCQIIANDEKEYFTWLTVPFHLKEKSNLNLVLSNESNLPTITEQNNISNFVLQDEYLHSIINGTQYFKNITPTINLSYINSGIALIDTQQDNSYSTIYTNLISISHEFDDVEKNKIDLIIEKRTEEFEGLSFVQNYNILSLYFKGYSNINKKNVELTSYIPIAYLNPDYEQDFSVMFYKVDENITVDNEEDKNILNQTEKQLIKTFPVFNSLDFYEKNNPNNFAKMKGIQINKNQHYRIKYTPLEGILFGIFLNEDATNSDLYFYYEINKENPELIDLWLKPLPPESELAAPHEVRFTLDFYNNDTKKTTVWQCPIYIYEEKKEVIN